MLNKVGRKSGKLKFFAPGEDRDYGFLIADGVDRDIWFHFDEIRSGVDNKADLTGQPYATAEFDLYETDKGFEARAIDFVVEQRSPYKGIRMWEMLDADGNEIIPEKLDEWMEVDSINLSRGLRLVVGCAQGIKQIKIVKKSED